MGFVYLIHLDRPVGHAWHYLGFTEDLDARLKAHATSRWEELPEPCPTENGGLRRGRTIGDGNPLLAFANSMGISWRLARIWFGGRDWERRLKRYKNARKLCPICSASAQARMNIHTDDANLTSSRLGRPGTFFVGPSEDTPCPTRSEEPTRLETMPF